MTANTTTATPLWLRVLPFPLVRLALRGPLFIVLIGISKPYQKHTVWGAPGGSCRP